MSQDAKAGPALPTPPAPVIERVTSVDTLRGLVILLMIFVNDLTHEAPSWLRHVTADADAMTFADIVFPAFLFIAGVSIPLAFSRAKSQGRTNTQLLGKVLVRTFALLVMGVVMVNAETFSPWPRRSWNALAYLAMFLAFAVVPGQPGRARSILVWGQAAGALALLALALAYRTADGEAMLLGPLFDASDTVWLRHSWWGILGLIGWAYLVASLIYLVLGKRREWLVGAVGCLALFYVAARADLPGLLASRPWLAWASPLIGVAQGALAWVGSHVGIGTTLGAGASITVAGCCLGSILRPASDVERPGHRLAWAFTFACGLALAGLLLDAPYGINKIRSTPSWCLYSAALTTVTWMALYALMDLAGVRRWARIIQPAGANPLLAYLLHPFVGLVVGLAGPGVAAIVFFYRQPGMPVLVGVAGSLLMALLVVQAAGWLARAGFRIRV